MSNYPAGLTQGGYDRETDRLNEPRLRHTARPCDPNALDKLRASLALAREADAEDGGEDEMEWARRLA